MGIRLKKSGHLAAQVIAAIENGGPEPAADF
jgi:hypothetical protein